MKTGIGIDDAVIVEKRIRITRDMEMDIVMVAGRENKVQVRTDIGIEDRMIAEREKTIRVKPSLEIDTIKIVGREKMILTKTCRKINGMVMIWTEHTTRMNTGTETDNIRIAARRMAVVTVNEVIEVTAQGASTTQVTT